MPRFHNGGYDKLSTYSYFKPHTLKLVNLTEQEYLAYSSDERKFGNLSYLELLDKIDSNELKLSEFGPQM